MKRPAKPESEAERIAALRALLVLDTEPEEQFDAMTAYCASRFDVEIALVTLVDTTGSGSSPPVVSHPARLPAT